MPNKITVEMIVEALDHAFRSAQRNSALSGLDALEIEHYREMKAAILAGNMVFEQAVKAAVAYHTEINKNFIPPEPPASIAEQNPYCYPGTDVLQNKLGIRDKQALRAAETEISTLRLAEMSLQIPAPAPPAPNPDGYNP